MTATINASTTAGVVTTADTSGILQLQTNGTAALTVDTSQNVLVGTTTANGVRSVIQGSQTGGAPQTSGTTQTYGLLRLKGTSFTSVLDFGTNGGTYNWIQATDSANLATNYDLLINPNGGNVGIGTSSPANKLQVSKAGVEVARFTNTQSNGADYEFKLGGGGFEDRKFMFTDKFSGADAVRTFVDSSGNFAFNSGYGSAAVAYGCRAWVNFNGTGTVAIRGSGNVSSITDNGTGDYTVNLTTAMPDVNYSMVGTSDGEAAVATLGIVAIKTTSPFTTTTARFTTKAPGETNIDKAFVCLSFFR